MMFGNVWSWVIGFVILAFLLLRGAKKNPQGFKKGFGKIANVITGNNKKDDLQEIVTYRGVDYEIDWKNERFIKVEKVGENFKSTPVRLPFHIWEEVFGDDGEED